MRVMFETEWMDDMSNYYTAMLFIMRDWEETVWAWICNDV